MEYVADHIDKLNEYTDDLESKIEIIKDENMSTEVTLPTRHDYSTEALKKALFKRANSHWTARYTLPAVGGIALFGFVTSSFLTVIFPIIVVLGVGGAMWVYNAIINATTFERTYYKGLQDRITEQSNIKRKDLKKNLLIYNCQDGARQLVQFQKKLDTLIDILQLKFDEGLVTYQRYNGIAQEVFLSGIDNLSNIVIAYKTIESVDIDYIKSKLAKLDRKRDSGDTTTQKEYDALMRAKQSYDDQQKKIRFLLSENTTALVEIDQTTVAISNIEKSKNNEASVDMEDSMNQLQQLAERSQIYSR